MLRIILAYLIKISETVCLVKVSDETPASSQYIRAVKTKPNKIPAIGRINLKKSASASLEISNADTLYSPYKLFSYYQTH